MCKLWPCTWLRVSAGAPAGIWGTIQMLAILSHITVAPPHTHIHTHTLSFLLSVSVFLHLKWMIDILKNNLYTNIYTYILLFICKHLFIKEAQIWWKNSAEKVAIFFHLFQYYIRRMPIPTKLCQCWISASFTIFAILKGKKNPLLVNCPFTFCSLTFFTPLLRINW